MATLIVRCYYYESLTIQNVQILLEVKASKDGCKDVRIDCRNEFNLDVRTKAHNDCNDAWAQGNTDFDYGSNINTITSS